MLQVDSQRVKQDRMEDKIVVSRRELQIQLKEIEGGASEEDNMSGRGEATEVQRDT
jgi:hypothetical protein